MNDKAFSLGQKNNYSSSKLGMESKGLQGLETVLGQLGSTLKKIHLVQEK